MTETIMGVDYEYNMSLGHIFIWSLLAEQVNAI